MTAWLFDARVQAEAVSRYGHPVTTMEALEFHALKRAIIREWERKEEPFFCGDTRCVSQCGRCAFEEASRG